MFSLDPPPSSHLLYSIVGSALHEGPDKVSVEGLPLASNHLKRSPVILMTCVLADVS